MSSASADLERGALGDDDAHCRAHIGGDDVVGAAAVHVNVMQQRNPNVHERGRPVSVDVMDLEPSQFVYAAFVEDLDRERRDEDAGQGRADTATGKVGSKSDGEAYSRDSPVIGDNDKTTLNDRSSGIFDPMDPLGVLDDRSFGHYHLLGSDSDLRATFGGSIREMYADANGRMSVAEAALAFTTGETTPTDWALNKLTNTGIALGVGLGVGAAVLVVGGPLALPAAIDAGIGAQRLTTVALEVTEFWSDMQTRAAAMSRLIDAAADPIDDHVNARVSGMVGEPNPRPGPRPMASPSPEVGNSIDNIHTRPLVLP